MILRKLFGKGELFLFAEDTNITGFICSIEVFNSDLNAVSIWLNDNKLQCSLHKRSEVYYYEQIFFPKSQIKVLISGFFGIFQFDHI